MPTGKFTQPPLELLRMFSKQYTEKVQTEIKDLLSTYFMEKASEEMDNLFPKINLVSADEFLKILKKLT